jgi:hypothetical protein
MNAVKRKFLVTIPDPPVVRWAGKIAEVVGFARLPRRGDMPAAPALMLNGPLREQPDRRPNGSASIHRVN